MICITFLLRRKPELSSEEFHRSWREEHGPLVARHAETLGIARYAQLHSLDPAISEALRATRGTDAATWDGVAVVWVEDLESLGRLATTPEGRRAGEELHEDERRFLDLPRCQLWLTEDHTVIG